MRRQGSSSTRLLVLVLQRGAGPGCEEPLERQPVQAHHLVAGRPVEAPAQAEDERRDHEVHRPPAGERLHLVEGAEPLAVSGQVEARLLEGLPHGGRLEVGVAGLAPPPGEAHVPRPRVLLVLRAPDEEQLEAALRAVAQDERHRRARGVPGEPRRGAWPERARARSSQPVTAEPASASSALGVGEPEERHVRRELAARQQGVHLRRGGVAQARDLVGLRPEAVERHVGAPEVARHVVDDVADPRAARHEPHVPQVELERRPPEDDLRGRGRRWRGVGRAPPRRARAAPAARPRPRRAPRPPRAPRPRRTSRPRPRGRPPSCPSARRSPCPPGAAAAAPRPSRSRAGRSPRRPRAASAWPRARGRAPDHAALRVEDADALLVRLRHARAPQDSAAAAGGGRRRRRGRRRGRRWRARTGRGASRRATGSTRRRCRRRRGTRCRRG